MTELNLTQVIGDKKGTGTAKALSNPKGLQDLQELQETVMAPVKLIHVIRNPFDNIATMCLRQLKERKPGNQVKVSQILPVNPLHVLVPLQIFVLDPNSFMVYKKANTIFFNLT